MPIGIYLLKKEQPPLIDFILPERTLSVSEKELTVRIIGKNPNIEFGQLVPLCLSIKKADRTVISSDLIVNYISADSTVTVLSTLHLPAKPGTYTIESQRIAEYKTFDPSDENIHTSTGINRNEIYSSIPFFRSAIQAKKGLSNPGYLVYGPYIDLKRGKYVLAFYLSVDNCNRTAPLVKIDASVAGENKNKVLTSKTLKFEDFGKENDYICFTLPFSLNKPKKMEFRVRYDGNSDLNFGGLMLFKLYPNNIKKDDSILFKKEITII